MKRPQLWLLAISPFPIGYLLDRAMFRFDWSAGIVTVFSALFVGCWFLAGRWSARLVESQSEVLLVVNSFAILSASLIVFQEVVLGRYAPGVLGIAPQMFYLPTLRLAALVERLFVWFLPHPRFYLWRTVLVALGLMMVSHRVGYMTHPSRRH